MTQYSHALVAIGNALVDVLAKVDDSFVVEQAKYGMVRGAMTLIDTARAKDLYNAMPPALERSGGSAGNTIAGFASLGGKGAYIGKVADDQLGEVFAHDIRALGITYETSPLILGAATGRCMILVTPDAQRTMNTYLGAAVELGPEDIDEDIIADAAVTYLEGYLFDPPQAKLAYRKAARAAHRADRKVALSLSDAFCVNRHHEDFLKLVEQDVDILFANESEIKALYHVESFEDAVKAVRGKCEIIALTRGEKGSVILRGDETVQIAPEPVSRVVDTTGAGDQYAAGFLYGLTEGLDLATCGRFASIAAAEVIGHMGPRPETSLADMIKNAA